MCAFARVKEFVPLLFLCLVQAGCGDKGHQISPVSGRVTLDGKALGNAKVSFVPKADLKLPYSIAKTDDDGKFTLRLGRGDGSQAAGTGGAVVGLHRVMISPPSPETAGAAAGSKMTAARTPPSELVPGTIVNGQFIEECTVPPGGRSDANFDLKSKG
jgi:hypothetical protein